jgi:hypothetical protein
MQMICPSCGTKMEIIDSVAGSGSIKQLYICPKCWFKDSRMTGTAATFKRFEKLEPMTIEPCGVAHEKLRICTECGIHHYENCPNCFGFGVYSNTLGDVVTAGQAYDYAHCKNILRVSKPCPVCRSTIKGLPND